VGTNLIGLSVRGQLRPKSLGGMPPMMGYRPGSTMTLSSYAYGYPSSEKELVIDEQGRIVRQAGDVALPIPLGQLAASLVQPFPAEATAGWENEADVFVLDEPMLQGPAPAFLNPPGGFGGFGYGGYPGRSAQGVLAARQKTTIKVTEVTPGIVTLQKTMSLDTRMLTGSEPRVSATSEGRIEFDRALRLPKRVELECKTQAVTENLSRRSVVTLRWQLLEGAEREKALAPPAPPPTEKEFTPEELAKLVEQLKSDDLATRQSAARELGGSRLDSRVSSRRSAARDLSGSRLGTPTPELLALMASLTNDPDDTVRHAALTILANHGGKEQVPLLIKALNDPDAAMRTTIARGLGRIKDPRAIEPLANLLATAPSDQPYFRPNRENAVADALVQIGPAAEPAALALLKEKNIETRCQACDILKQIGTKKSLGPLKDQTVNPSKELSEAAAEACRAIQSRETN
jgi:HEAT repeat protein